MKKFGKMMAAAAMAVSCLAISIPGYAAYSLSEEVKACRTCPIRTLW